MSTEDELSSENTELIEQLARRLGEIINNYNTDPAASTVHLAREVLRQMEWASIGETGEDGTELDPPELKRPITLAPPDWKP